jgi:hypothetical protein
MVWVAGEPRSTGETKSCWSCRRDGELCWEATTYWRPARRWAMLPAGDGTVDATAREAASWIAGAQDLRLGAHAGRRIAGALIAGRAGASWIAEMRGR